MNICFYKSEFFKRFISSIILFVIFIFCLEKGAYFFDFLVFFTMMLMVGEVEVLLGVNIKTLRGILSLIWPSVIGLSFIYNDKFITILLFLFPIILGLRFFLPILIFSITGLSLIFLRHDSQGILRVLFVIGVIVSTDSCAYFTGKILGGPKLVPSISPGKTISGALGGMIGAALFSSLFIYAIGTFSLKVLLYSTIISAGSQIGDLAESALKRKCHVKDSSHLIPGHGGVFDRFDGYVVAAPLAVIMLNIIGKNIFW